MGRASVVCQTYSFLDEQLTTTTLRQSSPHGQTCFTGKQSNHRHYPTCHCNYELFLLDISSRFPDVLQPTAPPPAPRQTVTRRHPSIQV